MIRRIPFICVAGFALAAGCNSNHRPGSSTADAAETPAASNAPATGNAPTVEEAASRYAGLQLLTPTPVSADREVFALCASSAVEAASQRARERAGPHALTAIRVFMNDSAAKAFRTAAKTYPVGAVIVKEKQDPFHAPSESAHEPVAEPLAVAGMIKRAPGYDATHGDWEYFYLADAGQLEYGRLASCIDCHRNAAASDYIFGDWFQSE